MELKMKNWNRILNNFVAGIAIVIVAMMIGLGFISPKSYAVALTKADIENYDIYFVSALTSSRTATGMSRVQLTGMDSDNNLYDFYSYQYNYKSFSDTNLYYGYTGNAVEDDTNGNVSISSTSGDVSSTETVFSPVSSELSTRIRNGFVPYGVNYFENVGTQKEEIFYNEIDDGDYVLINNYTNHTANIDFNVENFYLSFGTAYIDDNKSTPLYDLTIEAKLYSEGQTHFLALNETQRTQLDTKQYVEYWNQYFDLRSLEAYQKNQPNSPTYTIENQQGKYEFTFYFTRYNEKLEPVVDPDATDPDNPYLREKFTYTFYLLDSADYSEYPTIYNADIENNTLEANSTNQYYYSFNTASPFIRYNPTKYNLSYTRLNNKSVNNVSENVTSSYKEGVYTIGTDGINYEKGLITYYKGTDTLKQVFVLTHYNKDKTLVEHLYLSRKNITSNDNFNPTTYEVFLDNLESGNLQFEYKLTQILTENNDNTYTLSTYKTTTYENLGFLTEDFTKIEPKVEAGKTIYLVKNASNKVVSILDSRTQYETIGINTNPSTQAKTVTYRLNDGTTYGIATYGSYPQVTKTVEELTAGVQLSNSTLQADTNPLLDVSNTKYQLTATGEENTTKTYTLTKSYFLGENLEKDILLSVADAPLNEVVRLKDPIHEHIAIEYVVVEKTTEGENPVTYREIENITFSIRRNITVDTFSNQSNLMRLFKVVDYENLAIDLDYTYDYTMEELGIYDITYSYVSNATDNVYFTNAKALEEEATPSPIQSKLNLSNSTNYTAPVNFSASNTTGSGVAGTTKTSDLNIVVSGKVVDTKVKLNGEIFVYNAKTNTLTDEEGHPYLLDTIDNDYNVTGSLILPRTISVKTVNNEHFVTITYKVGELIETPTVTKTEYTIQGKSGYRVISNISTLTTYNLNTTNMSSKFPIDTDAWKSVIKTIKMMEDTPILNILTKQIDQATQGKDKLHIFGSIAYFNKADTTTDSNQAKLQQIDSRLGVNYVSDVTALYNVSENRKKNTTAENETASDFAGEIATLFKKDEIIVTDVTPVLWNNFSTLYYKGNNKKSMSYVFRYTGYKYDSDGKLDLTNATMVTSTYTKDIHCQFDGLYEVVVLYKYDNLPAAKSGNVYYQLFTFIIDNSSPNLILETENLREIKDTENLKADTTLSLTINGENLSTANGNFAYYSDTKTIVAWLKTNYNSNLKTTKITNFKTNITSINLYDCNENKFDLTSNAGEYSINEMTIPLSNNYYGPGYEVKFAEGTENYANLIIYFANSIDYADYDYIELDANSYTNKNVRISWEIPTYFQNDIFIEIDKHYYNTTNTAAQRFNFNAIFKELNRNTATSQLSTTVTNSNDASLSDYVKGISNMATYRRYNDEGVLKNFYYIDLKVKDSSTNYNLNGNYNIIVHYSTNGKSTFTEPFVIDQLDIAGLTIKSVLKNADGTFQVDPSIDFGNTQIVNSDFTFRFNRKESLADIFVYYDEIELISSSDYDKIVTTLDNEFGITTKYQVNGVKEGISVGTPYTYEYTHEYSQNYIASNNIISSNSSKLYLFRLQDEAGNQARFVVFYDGTEPRFLTVPKPDGETHIVNDTTRVIWGDYKAIKVSAETEFELTSTNNVTNYSKEEDDKDNNKLSLVLRYINSINNKNAFNDLKVEKIGQNYYILVPITTIKIEDSEYGNTFDLDLSKEANKETKDYYFFPTLPFVINEYTKDSEGKFIGTEYSGSNLLVPMVYNDDGSIVYQEFTKDDNGNPVEPVYDYNRIIIPEYNNDGSVVYDGEGNIKKVIYEVAPSGYKSQKIKDYNNKDVIRYVTITYYIDKDNNITNTITGAVGEGKFIYSVRDELNNKTSGLIWMNLDKTQTMAYGIFDYSDKLANAQAIQGTTESVSASKMFISSIVATENNKIPAYDVTYKHYAYDTSIYNDYTIKTVLLEKANDSLATYVNITLTKTGTEKTVKIQLTDEDGNEYPRYSYPYSLEGNAIVSETNGDPKDVYSAGSQFRTGDESRKFSLALNTTTDTVKEKIVTEEGLYIFKRTYTDKNIDKATLGTDKRIIYRVYYVDRSGIINISAGESVASSLYNVGKDIEFTLGNNYSKDDYKKDITASSIQNNQKANATSKTSNADYNSHNLFDTNKIQVEFRMTYDKYNFNSSIGNYRDRVLNFVNDNKNTSISADDKTKITSYLNNTLFNQRYFEDNYKIELQLNVGASVIIDETDGYFSDAGLKEFLKNAGKQTITNENNEQETIRTNNFDFYLDTASNSYEININDLAGYTTFNADGTINNANYLPNNLNITFDISHTAPDGEFYGKYYGRHNYDENKSDSDNPLNIPSIPTKDGNYNILKYLEEGQLDLLSDSAKFTSSSMDGSYVQLYSTNNETMIFTFAITNDEYKAQIDPDNIKIYKGGIATENLIFNKVGGNYQNTALVSKDRQFNACQKTVIGDTTYYAIIIFDNNLDDIIDKGTDEDEFLQYRLLDKNKSSDNPGNPDEEKYYVQLQYVGNANDYIGQDNNANKVSFFKTTFEIEVDRIKPMYNLTKLMSLDKYVYNSNKTNIDLGSNYESIFESYKKAYNFNLDTAQDFERSDLEKYFFSLDTRENTSFVFESVSTLDNNNAFYIRKVNKDNYKFSVTPDDYKAYYNATYLQGHPQFTPNTATTITSSSLSKLSMNEGSYYKIQFTLDSLTDNGISAHFLKEQKILEENSYYEIIEEDEAGNYRVYAVYVPQETANKIVYTYQTNSSASSLQRVSILYGNTPYTKSSGMELKFATIQTKDNFLKTTINIVASTNKSGAVNHNIEVVLDPNKLTVVALNRTLGTTLYSETIDKKDKDGYANTDKYIDAINYVLDYYYDRINNKEDEYYSEYGYNVYIEVIDRLGIVMKDTLELYNYEIDYVVAGSTLTPIFKNYSTQFGMYLEGQKGSTYLTDIKVYKFNKIWTQINSDNSSRPQIFDKSEEELKKPNEYFFNRGIYKFVFTDNFNRTTEHFYEYGISSSQTGGSLSYQGKYATLSDGYTYSAEDITYTYDSSVYNVYIKFVGKIPSEFADGEYQHITDNQNYVIFNSGITYTDEYLKTYGLNVITSGNITTITFSGVKDASTEKGITTLAQYQIKTILASTVSNYTWGMEENSSDIFAYNKKIALYTGIPNVTIKNTSGNTLDTSEHLNLTEDFNIVTAWPSSIATNDRLNLNARIILTRTYSDKGTIKTQTTQVQSGALITQPGEYSAYVINDLGMMSKAISFSRGEGEISMYAVYGVNSQQSTETKLTPSSMISTEELETETKVLFTYFITDDYFSYKDATSGELINMENFQEYMGSETLSTDFVTNVNANYYIDVRVNSNLSIKTEVYEIGFIEYSSYSYPYVKYQIYSDTKVGDAYIYRFIQVVFVDRTNTKLAETKVYNSGATDINLMEMGLPITSTSESVFLRFDFADETGFYVPFGDTIYIDRYYNGEFAETLAFEVSSSLTVDTYLSLNITEVGLHEFIVRDLAGRNNLFNGSRKLQIYLINEILFKVNGENPINNQVFNDAVDISIVFELGEFTFANNNPLYDDRTLNIIITRNGQATNMSNNNGEFTLTEAGYYNIVMSATTQLLDGTSTQVTSTFNCVIVDIEIATRSFSISKGTNFTIEKLIKSINGQESDITNTYSVSSTTDTNVLLWLSHEEQGNSIFKVTLKYYEEVSESYRTFDFSVWINNQAPVIISSIDPGTSTKDTITINYNPGLIYTQIGKGYITLDGEKIVDINSESISFVDTITISDRGEHWLKIYSEDGKLVGSYKFTKAEPMNGITKFIIIGFAIAAVVVAVLFLFLRRKGRYR